MNIYLDIDGVLITKQGQPASNLADFLKYITDNHNCFWLTTHCKGDARTALNYLQNKIDPALRIYLEKIKPTNWNAYKTEAIDFSSDFRWFDDYVFEREKQDLLKHNSLDKLILVEPNSDLIALLISSTK